MQLKKVNCFEGTRFYVFSRFSRRLSAGYCRTMSQTPQRPERPLLISENAPSLLCTHAVSVTESTDISISSVIMLGSLPIVDSQE